MPLQQVFIKVTLKAKLHLIKWYSYYIDLPFLGNNGK